MRLFGLNPAQSPTTIEVPELNLSHRARYWVLLTWTCLSLMIVFSSHLWQKSTGAGLNLFDGLLSLPSLFVLAPLMVRRKLIGRGALLAASPLFAYILFVLVSMLWAPDPDVSKTVRASIQLLALFVFFSYLQLTHNTAILRRALLLACSCTAFVAGWHLIVFYGVLQASWDTVLYFGVPQQQLMAYGVKPVNEVLGTLLVAPQAALLLGLLLDKRDQTAWLKVLGGVSLVILVTMIVALERRTGQLVIVVAITVCAVVYRNRFWYLLLGLTALAGALVLVFFPDFVLSRGVSWRPSIWLSTLDAVADAPVLGHGVTNTVRPVEVYDSAAEVVRQFRHPHNMALSVTYALGVLGLVMWLALWVPGLVVRALAGDKGGNEMYILLPVIAGVVALTFDGGEPLSTFHFNWFCFWIPALLLLSSQSFYGAARYSASESSRISRVFPAVGVPNTGSTL